jgi:two-component system, LytTR family, response regulator
MMKAIIIDDEKKGREILQTLINEYCKNVEVIAMAENADDGYTLIQQHRPDVIFLDIEMPNGNGFYLLEKFEEISFQVIFTTAYDHYAIKAIKYHALDYLLKPIDIDELKEAVAHVEKTIQSTPEKNRLTEFIAERKLSLTSRIALPVKEGIIYLMVADIIRVESDGSYSTFYTSDGKKYMVSKNLKEYEDVLPVKEFFRSHKSHLINIKKVKKFLRTDGFFVEMEDGSMVEISRRKKDEFLILMNEQE